MCGECDLIYVYDGSFEGMLSCIFAAFANRETPARIVADDELQPSLFARRPVETDPEHARRVLAGLTQKVSAEAAGIVRDLFLTDLPSRERLALDFTRMALREGPKVVLMMGDATVSAAVLAVRRAYGEAHKYKGLLRFSDVGGALVAEIEPKNFVLPLLARHFCQRFRNEEFLIWDKTHAAALVKQGGEAKLIPLSALELPPPDERELQTRRLWRRFFATIAITERTNPRCQRTNMPKRYWAQLTEMQDEDTALPAAAAAAPSGGAGR